MLKKIPIALTMIVLLVAAGLRLAAPTPTDRPTKVAAPPVPAAAGDAVVAATDVAPTVRSTVPAGRSAPEASPPALRVSVRWSDDASPAAGVGVSVLDERRRVYGIGAVTDASGTTTFEALRPGRYRIRTTHDVDGAVPAVEIGAGGTAEVALRAERRGTARGTVVDGRGRGVAGAAIWISRQRAAGCDVRFEVARSGMDGDFSVELGGESRLGAVAAGFVESPVVDVEPGTTGLRLVVDGEAARLTGTVLADGPVRGVRLVLLPTGDEMDPDRGGRATATDLHGRFRFDGLPSGRRALCVLAPGHAPERHVIDLEAGTNEHDFVLRPAASVHGRVLDAAGAPIEGAGIGLAESDAPWLDPSAVTDADGRYTLVDLAPGPTKLVCVGPGGGTSTTQVLLTAGTACDWSPVLGARPTIAGIVLDAGGRPCKSTWVSSRSPNAPRPNNYVRTDARGRFELQLLDSGPQTVVVGAPLSPPVAQIDAVEPGTTDLVVQLAPAALPTARMRGRVVDASGAAVGGRVVARSPDGDVSNAAAALDSDGAFVTPLVRPGRYGIQLVVGNATLPGPVVELAEGEDRDVGCIVVPATGSAILRVVDRDQQPIADGVAQVVGRDGGWSTTARVLGGVAHFAALPVGEHLLAVSDERGCVATSLVVSPGRQTEQFLDLRSTRARPVEIRGLGPSSGACLLAFAQNGAFAGFAAVPAGSEACTLRLSDDPHRIELHAFDGRSATASCAAGGTLRVTLVPR